MTARDGSRVSQAARGCPPCRPGGRRRAPPRIAAVAPGAAQCVLGKLTVSTPDDTWERTADRVAHRPGGPAPGRWATRCSAPRNGRPALPGAARHSGRAALRERAVLVRTTPRRRPERCPRPLRCGGEPAGSRAKRARVYARDRTSTSRPAVVSPVRRRISVCWRTSSSTLCRRKRRSARGHR